MLKLNSLAACSSASDSANPSNQDVVDIFGIDESSGDILQLHLENDVCEWTIGEGHRVPERIVSTPRWILAPAKTTPGLS